MRLHGWEPERGPVTPPPLSPTQLLSVHQLLDGVAERQRQDFGHISSDVKPDGSLITACDRWSDATLVKGLALITPGESTLSEEGDKHCPTTSAFWVVDPLDGTTNFAAGIPYWAISVARFVDGQPMEAFLEIPSLRQRIVAIRGRGAWRNGKQLTAETRRGDRKCLCVSVQPGHPGVAAPPSGAISWKDPSAGGCQPQSSECGDGADRRCVGGHPKDLGSCRVLAGAV